MDINNSIHYTIFEQIFSKFINSRIDSHNNPKVFIWNYKLNDINNINISPIKIVYPDFVTLRKLQMRSFNEDVIIIINDCYKIPKKILRDTLNNIHLFHNMIIFSDSIDNLGFYSNELLNECINFVVKYE